MAHTGPIDKSKLLGFDRAGAAVWSVAVPDAGDGSLGNVSGTTKPDGATKPTETTKPAGTVKS